MFYLIMFNSKSNYKKIDNLITTLGPAHFNSDFNTWFVNSGFSAQEIYDKISPLLIQDDSIFISQITNNWQSAMNQDTADFVGEYTNVY